MLYVVLNGLKFGIVLAFLIGPVFFTIIQTSIEKGFKKGVLVALGVSVSDAIYVLIFYFGLIQFFESPNFRYYLSYVGGLILILMGAYYLFMKSKRKYTSEIVIESDRSFYWYFLKGIFINGFSPTVPVFWLGAISLASLDYGYTKDSEFYTFFSVVLGTALIADIIKAFLAGKLRNLLTHRAVKILNITVGLCLVIFGVNLIWNARDLLVK